MKSKASAILSKAAQERKRGDYERALNRLAEGIEKMPDALPLYEEAIETALEAGASRRAVEFFKQAQRRASRQGGDFWTRAAEKIGTYNDTVFGKFLLETAVKKRALTSAEKVLDQLTDRAVAELLKRTRTKIQSLSGAMSTGFVLKGEILVNALSEALLCIRSKRFQEATRSFLRILDDKPIEHKVLTPFLAHLEQKYPGKGGISFALGCCYLMALNYEKALPKLFHGASLSPGFADDALAKLESLRGMPGVSAEDTDISLARLFLIKGDEHHAADRFGAILDRNSAKAPLILDLLKPYVQDVTPSLLLHYLYIETALLANRSEVALTHLRKIYQDRRRRADLFAWLDTKSGERFLPPEVLRFHGEICLEQNMYDKAIAAFREVAVQSPDDAAVIAGMLEPHRGDAAIEQFYGEISVAASTASASGPGFEIEHFGNRDFSLNAYDDAATAREAPADDIDRGEERFSEAMPGDVDGSAEPSRADGEYFDTETGSHDEAPGDAVEELGAEDNEFDAGYAEDPVADEIEGQQPEADLSFENAAAEPETDAGGDVPPDAESLVPDVEPSRPGEAILLGESEAPSRPEPAPEDPPVEPETRVEDFDGLFRKYQQGQLDEAAVIGLMETAAATGRKEELRALLSFAPQDAGLELARKYHLAGYYIDEDQPLSALVVLRSVPLDAVGKDAQRQFLLRLAHCYRSLNRYDAAHSVYLRIMSEHPDFEPGEHIARANYESYIQSLGNGAPVLEKMTTL